MLLLLRKLLLPVLGGFGKVIYNSCRAEFIACRENRGSLEGKGTRCQGKKGLAGRKGGLEKGWGNA